MDEMLLVLNILAGKPQCQTPKCNHIRRGINTEGKSAWIPGVYCGCCARKGHQGMYETDSYNCDGSEI